MATIPLVRRLAISTETSTISQPRFRLSFGLGNLLVLVAGFCIGMAAMQPWASWRRPRERITCQVEIIRIPIDDPYLSRFATKSDLLDDLVKRFSPRNLGSSRFPAAIERIANTSLHTWSFAPVSLGCQWPLNQKAPYENLVKLHVSLQPRIEGEMVSTGIDARYSWPPFPDSSGTLDQNGARLVTTQPAGSTKVVELKEPIEATLKLEHRIFVVITPEIYKIRY